MVDRFWSIFTIVGILLFGLGAISLRLMNGQFFEYSIFRLKEPYRNIVRITYPKVFFCFLIGLLMIITGTIFATK